MASFKQLLDEIRSCTACAELLPHAPRPVVEASPSAKLLIIGQAPGRRVHETGIPWNDPSGDRLRDWLQIDRELFYNPKHVALVPMGFCYPGKGKSGDLPPRPECAELWHARIVSRLKNVKLTLLVGSYAQQYVLGEQCAKTLTETVRAWRTHLAASRPLLPTPHPSPRNLLWLKRNAWFEAELVPELRARVAQLFK